MDKRDSWWDEGVLGVCLTAAGAWIGEGLPEYPVIGAIIGGLLGFATTGVIRWRYIKPLDEAQETVRERDQEIARLTNENAGLKGAKPRLVVERIGGAEPRLVVESIRSVVVDRITTFWLIVVRNDGESATVSAKYGIRGEAVEPWASQSEHHAVWGTLTVLRPPEIEVSIANGDRAEIRLAETGADNNPSNYPRDTVVRFVRVIGSNKLDPIQTYSQKHVDLEEGPIMPHPPPCVVTLSVYATPRMADGPLQRSFVVGLHGVKSLDLNVPMRAILLESKSPEKRVDETRKWFAEVVLAAKAGDIEAKQKVREIARVFYDASRTYGASGPLFQADYQIIRQAHEDLQMDFPVLPKP